MAQLPKNWATSPAALFSKNFMVDRLAKSVFHSLWVLIINRYDLVTAAGPDRSASERTKTQWSWEFGNGSDKREGVLLLPFYR